MGTVRKIDSRPFHWFSLAAIIGLSLSILVWAYSGKYKTTALWAKLWGSFFLALYYALRQGSRAPKNSVYEFLQKQEQRQKHESQDQNMTVASLEDTEDEYSVSDEASIGAIMTPAGSSHKSSHEFWSEGEVSLSLPDGAPLCNDNGGKRARLVCLGDSITQGSISANWVSAIVPELGRRKGCSNVASSLEVINNGQNNISTHPTADERADWTLQCSPDYVVVLIGTNDIRCPVDDGWHHIIRTMWKIEEEVTLESMEKNLHKILNELLQRSSAKIAISTIPPIGEDLTSTWNQYVCLYNKAVKRVAKETQQREKGRVTLLDLHSALISKIELEREVKQPRRAPASPKKNVQYCLLQMIGYYVLGFSWDAMGAWIGNVVLSDGTHLNEKGGNIMRDLVVDWLQQEA